MYIVGETDARANFIINVITLAIKVNLYLTHFTQGLLNTECWRLFHGFLAKLHCQCSK